MLCEVCSSIPQHLNVRSFLESDVQFNEYRHHKSFRDLQGASKRGCHLCNIILRSIDPDMLDYVFSQHRPSKWSVLLRRNGIVPRKAPPQSITVFLIYGSRLDNPWPQSEEVAYLPYEFLDEVNYKYDTYAFDDDGKCKERRFEGRSVTVEVLSQKNIDTMRFWITDCSTKHEECNHDHAEGLHTLTDYPTRLISVGKKNLRHPQLVNFDLGKRPYLALSHCWGSDPSKMLTTTKATYNERRVGIPFQSLPKSFQDAIAVTRELGYQYIWIDALCIIQDSPLDWETESIKMGAIYSNSMCCIAATSARSCQDGLGKARNALQVTPCIVEWPDESAPKDGLESRKTCQVKIWPLERQQISRYRGENRGPLDRRAWTLQEHISSSRIIQFAKREIYWSCKRYRSSESGDTYRNPEGWVEGIPVLGKDGNPNPRAPYMLWYNWLRQSSARKLTYESDKLPAIGGIARDIQRRTQDEYCAGLWEGDILMGLIGWWPALEPDPGMVAPKSLSGYRAPSWSWASLDGVVDILDVEEKPSDYSNFNAKISKVEVKLAGGDAMGKVKDGKLTISGLLTKIRVSKLSEEALPGSFKTWESGSGKQLGRGECFLDFESQLLEKELYFLLVVATEGSLDTRHWRGLCLVAVNDFSKIFRRAGVGEMYPGCANFDEIGKVETIEIL